jgi:hypothetical protein
MNRPPVLARLIVTLCCPSRDRVYVLGDLDAEYELRGCPAAWYWRQAIRSAGALVMMGARRGDWEFALLAVMLAAAGPPLLMEAWWSFVLSHVPLKVSDIRGTDFVVLSLALTALLSFGAGMICTIRGLCRAIPIAWLFALLAESAVHSVAPPWFGTASRGVLTASLTAGAWVRRIFDRGQVA